MRGIKTFGPQEESHFRNHCSFLDTVDYNVIFREDMKSWSGKEIPRHCIQKAIRKNRPEKRLFGIGPPPRAALIIQESLLWGLFFREICEIHYYADIQFRVRKTFSALSASP